MATIAQLAAKVVSSHKIIHLPEAATQSFKKGEFVYLVSGKVTVLPTTVQSQSKIAGMALRDASGTTDTAIPIAVAEEGVVFEANVYHSTAASAITAVTQVGASYGIKVSSNKQYVNIEDTTNRIAKIKRLSPKDTTGDQYGRVEFEIIGSRCQLAGQTS